MKREFQELVKENSNLYKKLKGKNALKDIKNKKDLTPFKSPFLKGARGISEIN